MSNFGYLKNKAKYKSFAEELIQAEDLYGYNTKICVRQCRAALEATVRWVYQEEGMNCNEMTLGQLVHNTAFIHLLDYKIWALLPDFVAATNEVVHIQKEADREDAVKALEVLFKFVQWIESNYAFFYVERTFDRDQIGLPDTDEETSTGKLFICNRKLLEKNSSQNIYNDSTKNKICLEKTLNSLLGYITFSNHFTDEIVNKNREWESQEIEGNLPEVNRENKSHLEKVEKLLTLAEQGSEYAQYCLGNYYYNGESGNKNFHEAVKWYIKAAKQGHIEAQYKLGNCYYNGEGIYQSYKEALKWYGLAAEQGHKAAIIYKKKCEEILAKTTKGNNNNSTNTFSEMVKDLFPSVGQGDAKVQYNLGCNYYKNESYEKAAQCFIKAAKQGYAEAQDNIGMCYYNGKGVEQSYEEAIKWFRKAAEQGNTDAQNHLAVCFYRGQGLVVQSYEEAIKWYTKAAEQGNLKAQYNLANCYYYGHGVARSYKEAIKWYTKSAEQGNKDAVIYKKKCEEKLAEEVKRNDIFSLAKQGNAEAQDNIGMCYYNGKGVEQDYEEAVKWFRKAAEQGNTDAQNHLAVCFYRGQGIAQSYGEAIKWYTKAAVQGHQDAQYNLANCYYHGHGVARSYEEAIKWYTYAAEQGNEDAIYYKNKCEKKCEMIKAANIGGADAKFKLAEDYECPDGDYEEAVKWYIKAAELGHAMAQCKLGMYYQGGRGVTQNDEKALKWFTKSAAQGNPIAISFKKEYEEKGFVKQESFVDKLFNIFK